MNPWQILSAHRKATALALVLQFFLLLLPLTAAWLTQMVIDQIQTQDFIRLGIWLVLGLGVLQVLTQTLARAWHMAQYDLLAAIVERLRLSAFQSALSNKTKPTGGLAARIQHDPDVLGAYSAEFYKAVLRIFFSFMAVSFLLSIHVWATVATVIPMLLFVLGIRLLQKKLIQMQDEVAKKESAVTTTLDEIIRNAPSILRHGGQDKAVTRYMALRQTLQISSVRTAFWQAIVSSLQTNLESLTTALVLLISAGELASGSITVGQYVLFTLVLGWIVYVPMRLADLMTARSSAYAAKERLINNLGAGSSDHHEIDLTTSSPAPMTSLTKTMQIKIENLPGLQSTLQFEIKPKSITVVQGAVGTGKTSLLEALIGNGIAKARIQIENQVLDSLEQMAGFASATPEFIDVSLYQNVSLDRQGDWNQAIALSALNDDVIHRSEGILINNLGLSGGQRSRLAIARASFDQAPILLLDDPTAALDEATANTLWLKLRQSELTIIVASNHPKSLAIADQVIVLGN